MCVKKRKTGDEIIHRRLLMTLFFQTLALSLSLDYQNKLLKKICDLLSKTVTWMLRCPESGYIGPGVSV